MRNNFVYFLTKTLIWIQISINVKAIVGPSVRTLRQNELPHIVCISKVDPSITTDENLLCTGTFITQTLILTSAHCFDVLPESMIQIEIRNHNSIPGVAYYPIWWTVYRIWATATGRNIEPGYHDIGLLKLYGILPDINPAPISQITPITMLYGLMSQAAGCGRTTVGITPLTIKTAFVKLLTDAECQAIGFDISRDLSEIPIQIMCSNNNPYVILELGDSGGPLFYFNTLIGIHSGIYPDMPQFDSRRVNVHTKIDFYREFINEHINCL